MKVVEWLSIYLLILNVRSLRIRKINDDTDEFKDDGTLNTLPKIALRCSVSSVNIESGSPVMTFSMRIDNNNLDLTSIPADKIDSFEVSNEFEQVDTDEKLKWYARKEDARKYRSRLSKDAFSLCRRESKNYENDHEDIGNKTISTLPKGINLRIKQSLKHN